MRILLSLPMAALWLSSGLAAAPPSQQQQCRNACDSQYHYCLRAATTKAARKSCSVLHKPCKKGCTVTKPMVIQKHS